MRVCVLQYKAPVERRANIFQLGIEGMNRAEKNYPFIWGF